MEIELEPYTKTETEKNSVMKMLEIENRVEDVKAEDEGGHAAMGHRFKNLELVEITMKEGDRIKVHNERETIANTTKSW